MVTTASAFRGRSCRRVFHTSRADAAELDCRGRGRISASSRQWWRQLAGTASDPPAARTVSTAASGNSLACCGVAFQPATAGQFFAFAGRRLTTAAFFGHQRHRRERWRRLRARRKHRQHPLAVLESAGGAAPPTRGCRLARIAASAAPWHLASGGAKFTAVDGCCSFFAALGDAIGSELVGIFVAGMQPAAPIRAFAAAYGQQPHVR